MVAFCGFPGFCRSFAAVVITFVSGVMKFVDFCDDYRVIVGSMPEKDFLAGWIDPSTYPTQL